MKVFVDRDVVDECVRDFLRAASERDIEITTYCVMPDHVHMLIEGTSDTSHLPSFAALAKQYSGYCYRRKRERRLWQDGYYDHVLRDNESTKKVARYVIENPVGAGLVATVYDYPFVGSSRYTRGQLIEWVYYWGDGSQP